MQPEHWLATPLGRRCLTNEQRLVRRALDCAFGEQFLQMIDADVLQMAVRSLLLVGLGALSVMAAVVWSRTRPQTI